LKKIENKNPDDQSDLGIEEFTTDSIPINVFIKKDITQSNKFKKNVFDNCIKFLEDVTS